MTSHSNKEISSLINTVMSRCHNDKAFAAALKKADTPQLEYLAWEYFVQYKIPLDDDDKRLPYALIFAAIAKSKNQRDGKESLGSSLALAYESDGGKDSSAAQQKLRRLIACESISELFGVLRPLLHFIIKKRVDISFSKVLADLVYFDKETTPMFWAKNFFTTYSAETEEGK